MNITLQAFSAQTSKFKWYNNERLNELPSDAALILELYMYHIYSSR